MYRNVCVLCNRYLSVMISRQDRGRNFLRLCSPLPFLREEHASKMSVWGLENGCSGKYQHSTAQRRLKRTSVRIGTNALKRAAAYEYEYSVDVRKRKRREQRQRPERRTGIGLDWTNGHRSDSECREKAQLRARRAASERRAQRAVR